MMRFCTILTALLLFSCAEKPKKEKEEVPVKVSDHKQTEIKSAAKSEPAEQKSKYRTVSLFEPQIGWGYDIFEGSKLLIHQPNIPVVQGLRGFKTEEDALKVADAVVLKLEQGIMPPTLTLREMQDLGVL
jgi:hypothetical protein